ncbi:MAG: hypothetical protein K8J31_12225 [Anaerolineae bacterium]|nr:hypothetical protein [Anaerolineae bacterium]
MPRRLTRLRPWMLVTLLILLYVTAVIRANGGDALALVTLGTQFSAGIPADQGGTEGYDGQFNYYIARDPSTAAPIIDVPAYRFQRILLPGLGWALSFGSAALIPWIFLLIGLISLAAGTALMEQLLVEQGVSRWYALAYGLTIGTFGSVRLSLPEPLAYALALGGIWLFAHDRWRSSAVLFALAALARETTLLIPAAIGLHLLYQRRWRTAGLFGLISLLPFVIWQMILSAHLGSFGIGSGGAMATGFEIIPFAGIARIVLEVPAETRLSVSLIFAVILVPFVLIPTLWSLRRGWLDWRQGKLDVYSWMLLANAAIMPFVPFSTYREPLGILRFIVGLQIALVLYAAHRHHPRAMRNSTIWIVTTLLIFSLI